MSNTIETPIDYKAIVARIDRDLMEAGKLRQATRKFVWEHDKRVTEEARLRWEARKLDRDRWIAPWLAITGLVGGLITVGGAIWRLLH